jgi:hypothetical protein
MPKGLVVFSSWYPPGRISRAEFDQNLAEKPEDGVFLADMGLLLRTGISWDVD